MQKAFIAFEKVRQSGVTNMFDRTYVCALAGITVDEYNHIIKNYDSLKNEFALGLDLEIQRTELTDKEKFMVAYDDVKDNEVQYGVDYDIFENGKAMLETYKSSDRLIISKGLNYADQLFIFCDDNEIQEIYFTNKVIDEEATNILACCALTDKYQFVAVEFEKTHFSETLFKFIRKEVA